jgi:class 3 adenylate cyclase/tetratricopeptide (TPR) repeat protein
VTFKEVLAQVIDWLQQDKRLSYRALQRQFALDSDYLDDLKAELIEVRRVAVDEDGRVLVWTGDTSPASATPAVPTMPGTPGPLTYTPSHLAEKILTSRSALEGERKQVTVLFADLKGSMELLADRDPEEARQILDPVLKRMMDAVHRYEGTVNQVMGDGIMALFGAPIAHEDHAIRACYAALAMHTTIRAYAEDVRRTHGIAVQIRVGLNAGEVVVRAIGNDLHMDYSAVGQTVHMAARMEQLAHPGSTLLTADMLRLVEGLVQVTALGPIPVKGLPDPVEVFELIGASALRRRFQAAAARGLTPFVGRQQELDAVYQALARARTGQGQVVALVGEAGVGKSRLVHECVHLHRTQGWRVLESAAVSYGKATLYFPVIDLLKRYCHVDDGDDIRTIRAKVTGQVLTLDATLQDTLPALLALLEAAPEDSPFLRLDPPQRRQHTLEGLKRVLRRESQVQPLLLVFEDLHWIDSETQALLDRLAEVLPTTRLLLLVNYRPEYQHGWGSKTYYTQLRLTPLQPASAEAFLTALMGDDPSLVPLSPLLIARTQGNPFFLEESVRTLVETGILAGAPGAYRLVKPLESLQVPATVQATLAARIDRLPPEEKQLLQTAAVIGTEVPLTLLQAIAEVPEEPLRLGLIHLQAAEFLYETRLFPDIAYTFKHALTQQVAYETLLQERRRALHTRIVEALEALAGEGLRPAPTQSRQRVAEQIEHLAHHALRGEVWNKALAYCWQAGEKAMARSVHREAVGYFEQALSVLPHLPDQRDTREQAIDLRFALRSAVQASGDFARILVLLREAEALAVALNDSRRQGRASLLLSRYFSLMGTYDQAIAASQRALALATVSGDVVLHALANQFLGVAYHSQGDYRRAIDSFRQTVMLLDGARRYERFGQVFLPAVFSRAWLTRCHAELGAFAEGCTLGEEGLQIAKTVAHPASLMLAYYGLGLLALRQGNLPRALPLLERAVGSCEDATRPATFPAVATALGAAYALGGRRADAVPLLTSTMEQTMTMMIHGSPVIFGYQALCHLSLGEAQAFAVRALELARTHQAQGHQAYALHLLGEIAAHREPPEAEPAETHYHQALALAEALGMCPLAAHCHHGLGRLYSQTGQREQARTALTTAIEMYRTMDMMFWLPQAEAALAQIG